LLDYEDKVNYQSAFENEIMYRQGLLDGLNYRNTIIKSHEEEQFVGEFKEGTGIR